MGSMLRSRTRKGEADLMRLEWTLSTDLLRQHSQDEINTPGPLPAGIQKLLLFLNLIAAEVLCITKGVEPAQPHFNQFLRYVDYILSPDIQQQLEVACQGYVDVCAMTSEERQTEIDRLAPLLIHHARPNMIYLIYKNILRFWEGEDPLQMFMNTGDLWQRLLAGEDIRVEGDEGLAESAGGSNLHKADMISLIANTMAGAKILEVGGGTGAGTERLLDSLTEKHVLGPVVRKYHSFTFTDLSVAFVSQAKSHFENNTRMRFQTLDITKDPVEQGFEQGAYDIVFAVNVLHVTEDISVSLGNITKLLRPNGKLLLVELRKDSIGALDYPFILGTLHSFWGPRKEQNRQHNPLLSTNEWAAALEAAGFRIDYTSLCLPWTASGETVGILATYIRQFPAADIVPAPVDSLNHPAAPSPAPIVIIYRGSVDSTVVELQVALQSAFAQPVICMPFDSDPFNISDATFVVSVIEIERSLIYEISASDYAKLHYLMTSSLPILWVTSGVHIAARNPKGALITGLARSARNENSNLKISLLDLSTEDPKESARHIARTLQYLLEQSPASVRSKTALESLADWEFCEHNGEIFVPRLSLDYETRNKYLPQGECQLSRMELFSQPKNLKLVCTQKGMLSSLVFEEVQLCSELLPNYIEIAPESFGLNFKDIATVMGLMPMKSLGVECYGTVTRVGSAVSEFRPGDVVFSVGPNEFGNRVQVYSGNCGKLPTGADPIAFTASIVVYVTVIRALKQLAELQEGEKVLIHCAAGGVGIAAIHYAKLVGAEIFATCGSEAKRSFLIETHGIPPERIFSSRDVSFCEGVMGATYQEGVDVILNCLSGELLAEGWKCLAPQGRFIELGLRDILYSGDLDLSGFMYNTTYAAVDLAQYFDHQNPTTKRLMHDLLHDLTSMYAAGSLPPIAPITQFSISEIESAMRFMAGGTHMGKIMICVKPDAVVKVSERASSATFDPCATYLLVGGLGGIGCSLAIWMAEQGAKHLTFFSRSGISATEGENVKITLQDLNSLGCKYDIIQCDVGANACSVEEAILEVTRQRPILGVVHTAMVLKDRILDNMSHEDFMIPLRSKVNGLLNLQSAFDNNPALAPLDFFVVLSSASGVVGNPGQANYAAAATFQDAFVHFRQMQGQPASVLDLGFVTKVGYAHEMRVNSPDKQNLLRSAARLAELSPRFVHKAFEMAIGTPTCGRTWNPMMLKFEQDKAQFFLGLDLSSMKGIVELNLLDRKWGSIHCAALEIADTVSSGIDGLDNLANFENPFRGDVESRPANEVIDEVTALIIHKTAALTMIPVEDIKPTHSLHQYGMDSLVAVELKNWLFKAIMVELSVADIMESTSVRKLGEKVYNVYMTQREAETPGNPSEG